MPKVIQNLTPNANQEKVIKEALTELIKKTNDLRAKADKKRAESEQAQAKANEGENFF